MLHTLVICAVLLLATAAVRAEETGKDGDKLLSGMSIVGNDDAPKSLVIVPWKSSELGHTIDVSKGLDDGRQPVDRDVFMHMPRFRNMHRFMPALFQREGCDVVSLPVNHRERVRGTSKYGLHNRRWVGIVDLFGVSWLIRRASPRAPIYEET